MIDIGLPGCAISELQQTINEINIADLNIFQEIFGDDECTEERCD
jgi:hypothetical protein